MNRADVAWMLASTALVLLMTPALAFFYGGLVRSKNALNTMMMSFTSLGAVGLAWALLGYSLAFAPGSGLLGGKAHVLLRGVGLDATAGVGDEAVDRDVQGLEVTGEREVRGKREPVQPRKGRHQALEERRQHFVEVALDHFLFRFDGVDVGAEGEPGGDVDGVAHEIGLQVDRRARRAG